MSRLGTPYQKSVATQTGDYTILAGDDFIPFNIAGAQAATLPTAASCIGDSVEKVIANLGTSGGTLTLTAASGDTLTGASSLTAGQGVHLFKAGPNAWTAEAPFSAEGLTVGTITTADSKGVSAGVRASAASSSASLADSKGVSGGTAASVASSMGVIADSKGVSAGAQAVVADSKGVSGGVAASVASSAAVIADSKGVSGGVAASVASSQASLGISVLTSRVSSKGG